MEGGTAIVLAIIVLAGGGATGAVMMAEDGDWMGGHDDGGNGVQQVEPLPYQSDDGSGSCSLGRGDGAVDCDQASGGCSSQEDAPSDGGCCC